MLENELGPKGYVVISDKDGNVIREGHNMVLLNGKKMVASNLIKQDLFTVKDSKPDNINDFSNYKITHIAIYSDGNETIFNENYSISDNIIGEPLELSTSNTKIYELENSDGHFYIKISFSYKGKSQTSVPTANSIGLIATQSKSEPQVSSQEGSSTDPPKRIMFSRIRFDSVVLTTETEFNISYYLYF